MEDILVVVGLPKKKKNEADQQQPFSLAFGSPSKQPRKRSCCSKIESSFWHLSMMTTTRYYLDNAGITFCGDGCLDFFSED